jgi:hypothetical protein
MQVGNSMVALCAALTVIVAGQAQGSTTTYTSSAAFLADVAPGAYTETFTGPPTPAAAPSYSFAQGGYAYTVAGVGQQPGTWTNGSVIGNNYPNWPLVVTFTSGNVTAVGGEFFIMDAAGGFTSASVTVTLNDGTSLSYTPSSQGAAFRGFISTSPITSLTFAAGALQFNAIDNLVVGSAAVVAEPASAILMSLGLGALIEAGRRFRR